MLAWLAWLPRLAALALALAWLSACTSGDESISTEVVTLAQGQYYGARWGATQVERFYTLAWKGTPQDPEPGAVIVSAEHEKPCELGASVARYTSLRPQTASKYVIRSPSPARVVLLEDVDPDGFGTLRFADIDCQRIDLSVPDVKGFSGYVYDLDQMHQKLAVQNRYGTLSFVDPWKQEQKEVAYDVQAFATFETGEWLIEGGELVKRDLEGKELLRTGSKVAGFIPLGQKGDVVYQEARGIYTIRSGEAKRIAKSGCLRATLDSFLPNSIGYFTEPCDAKKLRVIVYGSAKEEAYDYSEHTNTLVTSAGMLVYTTTEDDQTKVWIVDSSDPKTPKTAGSFARFALLGMFKLQSDVTVLMTEEEDGLRTIWQLLRSGDRASLVELTRGVKRYTSSGNGIALLYDNGDLVLADGGLASEVLRVPDSQDATFNFVLGGKALGLAYLSHVHPETLLGTLELHLLTGEHYTLARNVREFEYVWWPERGLSYVAGGDDPGIRFARIDIPCEATSDAPWACGF